MEYGAVILLGITTLGILLFLLKDKKQRQTKSSYQKKEEIIQGYKNQLTEILRQNSDSTPSELQHKKMAFIKTANQELNNNIFFTEEEIKKIIQELALL